MQNQPCQVCTRSNAQVRFGVIVCEACKKFFQRNRLILDKLKCPTGLEHCDTSYRNKGAPLCPRCRLQKCFAVGMRILKDGYGKAAREYTNRVARDENSSEQSQESNCTTIVPYCRIERQPTDFGFQDCESVLQSCIDAQAVLHGLESLPLSNTASKSFSLDSAMCWRGAMDNFNVMSAVCASFAKKLPGFSSLTPHDRCLLFGKSLIPITMSMLSILNGMPFFGMTASNKNQFVYYLPVFERSVGQFGEVGSTIKSFWMPGIAELALLQALLFYQACPNLGLQNRTAAQTISLRLKSALKLVWSKSSPTYQQDRLTKFMHVFDLIRCVTANHAEAVNYLNASRPGLVSHNKAYMEMLEYLKKETE